MRSGTVPHAQQQAIRRFAIEDKRQLAAWSRDAVLKADPHLPALLDSLLVDAETDAEALARRLSASQVLLHPFHDVGAALEVSSMTIAGGGGGSSPGVLPRPKW